MKKQAEARDALVKCAARHQTILPSGSSLPTIARRAKTIFASTISVAPTCSSKISPSKIRERMPIRQHDKMATPQIAPILRLPTEILEGICIQIERDSHRDLTRFSVACKAIRIAAERVVFAKVELLTKFNTRASGAHHYARVAQNRPRLPSRSFQAVFLSPAPRVLEFTR